MHWTEPHNSTVSLFWILWVWRGEAVRKCTLPVARAHPLGSLSGAQLLRQSRWSSSVQESCWYREDSFLFPESFTLGLSYPSFLELATPVSCHIKLWTEVSDLRHVSHSRARLCKCAFWPLGPDFWIEFCSLFCDLTVHTHRIVTTIGDWSTNVVNPKISHRAKKTFVL